MPLDFLNRFSAPSLPNTLPLHPTTADQLRLYAQERKRLHYDGLSDAFFVSEQGSHLCYDAVWQTFVGLARRAGIRHDEDTIEA